MKKLAAVALLLCAAAARGLDPAAVFQARCKLCHGTDGKGSPAGRVIGVPDLTAVKVGRAEAGKVIASGKGKMIGFKGKLSDADIDALAGYVASGLK